jgi:ligand-binding sensor domain-containing protein
VLARAVGLATIFFLLLPMVARAQDGVGARQVRFRTYTPSDGLSQATARALVQDRDGFVWIGTQDGLNRFDGYSFRVYKHDRNDPTTLSHNHVWALLADADGSVWIGTQAGGLDRYDPTHDRFVAYASTKSTDGTVPSQLVTALLRDRGGRIWVANGDGRLQWVDRVRHRLVDTPLGESASLRMVRAMLQASDGTIWIGTYEGLYRTTTDAKALVEVRAGEQHRSTSMHWHRRPMATCGSAPTRRAFTGSMPAVICSTTTGMTQRPTLRRRCTTTNCARCSPKPTADCGSAVTATDWRTWTRRIGASRVSNTMPRAATRSPQTAWRH